MKQLTFWSTYLTKSRRYNLLHTMIFLAKLKKDDRYNLNYLLVHSKGKNILGFNKYDYKILNNIQNTLEKKENK